jgi:hypothetical protein
VLSAETVSSIDGGRILFPDIKAKYLDLARQWRELARRTPVGARSAADAVLV